MEKRSDRSDSLESEVAATQSRERGYQVPYGLKALTKREKTAWNQYTGCRTSWSEPELRTLHRIVKTETKLEKLLVEANKAPYTYEKAGGSIAEHPIHVAVRSTEKLIHSQLRVIGLNTSPERAVGTSRNGKLAVPGGEDAGEKPSSKKTRGGNLKLLA
ncbi:hypothetical protein [Parahaliea mediterranea]|uniref:hypothetical protein n=1 Tax=Parahaliea mediterranea TaxID=651086 RepID=UPI000E2F2AE2|nr:hypothetical protein [Parahaliea mediterranea]